MHYKFGLNSDDICKDFTKTSNCDKFILIQANIGGTLGLLTGFSVVSFYEVVHLLIKLLGRAIGPTRPTG